MKEYATRADFNAAKIAIQTDNARLCLSPARYLGACYQCPIFKTPKGKVCESAQVILSECKLKENALKEKAELKIKLKEIEARLSIL